MLKHTHLEARDNERHRGRAIVPNGESHLPEIHLVTRYQHARTDNTRKSVCPVVRMFVIKAMPHKVRKT